jgi:phage-related baseplate assembly protein
MPKTKNTPIKYTSRDFSTIKEDLVEHAKRFYPDQYKDFSVGTVNSLLMDQVAYVGDVLSFYLDYSVNESFLDTALERKNVRKHARSLGYRFSGTPSSYGTVAMYVLVPAVSDGTAPDTAYLPIVKRGTTFESSAGASYVLTEDVRFDDADNEVVAARFNDTTGATTFFAVRAYGQITSGIFQRATANLTNANFEKFRRIRVGGDNISEIISVVDTDGNEYYQVENLAQEVIFNETTNKDAATDGVRSILKPFIASRRFVMEQDDTGTYIQFGFGDENDEPDGLIDPSKVFLRMHGQRQVTDLSFDPTQLVGTSKLGLAPQGTELTIVFKVNTTDSVNAASNTIQNVTTRFIEFDEPQDLSQVLIDGVISSLEVTNEEPVSGDASTITNQEIKERAKAYYAMQNRAVTRQDYESAVYNMPKKFGEIKRASIVNDPSATNRRMALYVTGLNSDGQLEDVNQKVKTNLKNWITHYKSMNDVIDIFDAKIVNFGVEFRLRLDNRFTDSDVLSRAIRKLQDYFEDKLYIGEPVYINRLYSLLGKVDGVVEVRHLKILQRSGSSYSSNKVNLDDMMSRDGSFIKAPKNVIMELKFPDRDIKGTIIR